MLMVLPFRAAPAPVPRICSDMLSETLVEHFLQRRWLRLHAVARPATGAENAAIGAARPGSSDYCLSGTIRFSAGSDVLHAELVDVRDDRILWAQHFTVPPPTASDQPQSLPPDLLAQLVNTVEARIDRAEQLRACAGTAAKPTPMALIMRGRWHLYRATTADARIAEALFADAVARQPDSAQALIHLAQARAWSIWSERQDDAAIRDLRRLACRAIAADHEDYRGHLLCGVADTWRRQTAAALISLERAIALASSAMMPQAQLGSTLYLAGRPDEAQVALDAAVRLSPHDSQLFWVRGQLAMTALMRDDVAMAVGQADAALAARAGYWFAHVIKINALARSENGSAAREALSALMTGKPSFDAGCIDWVPFVDPAWNAYLKQGLALAAAAGNEVAADTAGPGAPPRRPALRRPPARHQPSRRQPAILHR
jgi:tetratricopeptide (TPR) repeat protein